MVVDEQAAGCAAVRRRLGEPLLATAPERIRTWLLVEHPGPWPVRGLPDDLPPAAAAVLRTADDHGIRTQLIRRIRDRRQPTSTVFTAGRDASGPWLERRDLRRLDELADLDLSALRRGEAPGFGARDRGPVALVCTHGRRDVCCARLGRPTAVALDRALPGRVWEATHLGGDRFAATVVSLPAATYHGGLTAADVPELQAALTDDRVLLPRLRGRAGTPAAEQAAEHFVREQTGLLGVDAVRATSVADDVVEVVTATADRFRVRVRRRHLGGERLTSCADGGTTGSPSTYDLDGIEQVAAGQPVVAP